MAALDLGILQGSRDRHCVGREAVEPVARQVGAAGIADQHRRCPAPAGRRANRSRPRRGRARRRCRRPARGRRRAPLPRRSSETGLDAAATPLAAALRRIAAMAKGSRSLATTCRAPAIGPRRSPRGRSRRRSRAPGARPTIAGMIEEVAGEGLAAGPGEGPERRRQAESPASSSSVFCHSSVASSATCRRISGACGTGSRRVLARMKPAGSSGARMLRPPAARARRARTLSVTASSVKPPASMRDRAAAPRAATRPGSPLSRTRAAARAGASSGGTSRPSTPSRTRLRQPGHVGGDQRPAAGGGLQQRARQTLAAPGGQAGDMVVGPDRGHVARRAVPGDAVAAPVAQGRLGDRPAVRGIGSAVQREFDRRALRAGEADRLDGDVDALRPEHAGDDGHAQRRHAAAAGAARRRAGSTPAPPTTVTAVSGGSRPRAAGVVRVLEQEAGARRGQRAADQRAQAEARRAGRRGPCARRSARAR